VCLSVSFQYSLEFVEGKQPVCVWGFFFCFPGVKFYCLVGSCSLGAVMMFLGRAVWSALVVKWSASWFQLLCCTTYPIVVSWGRRVAFWLLLGRDEVFLCFVRLGWPWKFWWAGLLVLPIFVSGGRKERVDWVVLFLEMRIASIAAVFRSWSSDCRRWSMGGLVDGSGSGQFLNFLAKKSQSALSVIHLGGIWIPGGYIDVVSYVVWNESLILVPACSYEKLCGHND